MHTRKLIFITGAAHGIGAATARLFAERQWLVALFDRDGAALRALAKELGPACLLACEGDVTRPDDLEAAFREVDARHGGRLDALFNNAGIILVGPFGRLPLEQHRRVVDVNLQGVLHTTWHALPLLRRTPGSAIVSMSSASAIFGNPELPVYAATKAAVKSLTEGLAIELEPYGIRVSDLLPIYVRTRMVFDHMGRFSRLSPKDVRLTPEQIAHYVWRAVHGRRLHWYVGADTKAFALLARLLPARWGKRIVRWVIGYRGPRAE